MIDDRHEGGPPDPAIGRAFARRKRADRFKRWGLRFAKWLVLIPFIAAAISFAMALLLDVDPIYIFYVGAFGLGVPLLFIVALLPLVVIVGASFALVTTNRATPRAGRGEPDSQAPALRLGSERIEAMLSDPAIASRIDRFEADRKGIARAVLRRRKILLPLGLAAGIVLAVLSNVMLREISLFVAAWVLFVVTIGAFVLTEWRTGTAAYRADFKDVFLPALLARFGELRHLRDAPPPDLTRLCEVGLLPGHNPALTHIDDSIHGRFRGRPIRIDEIRLKTGSRETKTQAPVFEGLLVVVETATPFAGATLVTDRDPQASGRVQQRAGLAPVWLEDPMFEQIYRVFASDQVAARAVMSPHAMETLLTVSNGEPLHPPCLFAEGRRLAIALSHSGAMFVNLFEAPDLTTNDARAQIAAQYDQIAGIFAVIGSVLDTQRLRLEGGPEGAIAVQPLAGPGADDEHG